MRIRELLENKDFNDLEFVKKNGHSEELDYDLVEDLIHYMNEDDDAYRRHIYPVVSKCINSMKANRKTDSSVFKNAVAECYKTYIKKFPIRQLQDNLEDDLLRETCKKMYEETCKHFEEGKYKD